MSVDKDTVNKIARLSRIAISDAEADKMVGELNGILAWVEQLGEVDVTGVEPMTAVISNKLRLRDDVVTETDQRALNQASAPSVEDGLYLVPKVVE